MKTNYVERLLKKAEKQLNNGDIYQYDYLMVAGYIDSSYKKNREGYLSYIGNLFFEKCMITLSEYQRLFDLA